jgi:riboflavin transporter FmnP
LSDAQNKVNFTNDNVTDIIISYYGVALVVELVAAVVLMKNSLRPWLSKTQSVWIGAVMGMFMGGSFVSEAITAAKLFVEISVGGDLLCAYKDCDSLNLFKW